MQAVDWLKENYWQQQLSSLSASKAAVRKMLEKYAELVSNPKHNPDDAFESISALLSGGVLTTDVVKMELVPQLLIGYLLPAHSDEAWQPWGSIIQKLGSAHPKLPAALLVATVAMLIRLRESNETSNQYVKGGTYDPYRPP